VEDSIPRLVLAAEDELKRDGARADEVGEQPNVAERALHAVLRLSGVVSPSVDHAADHPDEAGERGEARRVQPAEEQRAQEDRVHLQGVLMSSLNAVEHRVFITVHSWVLHIIFLTSLHDVETHPLTNEDRQHE